MKRKRSLVVLGVVLSILLGQSSMGTQPGSAHMGFDCESDRFNAFMNADDQYTTTFRSWYFDDPISCFDECDTTTCDGLIGGAWTTCMSTCMSSCETDRHNLFTGAQNDLIAAANQPCSYNPDFCAEARSLRDQCVQTYLSQMENPVLDENGHIESIWWGVFFAEYDYCRVASGIDNGCE